jgi:molecular chaperone GrpE
MPQEAARPDVAEGQGREQEIVREPVPVSSECEEWRERALRLQAEMENYRRRQRRIAQDKARAEYERLLGDLLSVADNMDRTLVAIGADTAIRKGVELTQNELTRLLKKHGLERVNAVGEQFDPNWHEAADVVPAAAHGVKPGTVLDVTRPGYRRDGKLFRPAQVVVAK